MHKPELLAPAGNYESAITAIDSGANAIYFGGKNFSARNLAANLSYEEIEKTIDYAHLRNAKCYAAVNTLVKNEEFRKLFDYINFLYSRGIDALIIQDLGVYNLCRKYFPDLPLHASTQMSAHNLNDVLVLKKMGFKRVVLSRELTLEEIKEIKEKSQVEIECFVHGALCFSYSGRCLASSLIGGRSGNRGRCAQPCRKKYTLTDADENMSFNESGYFLSTRDLCALDMIDKLLFIDSLKIEGRMKSARYVKGVVEKYRKHIDASASGEKLDPEADKKELALIFNRGGFCTGYFQNKKPWDLVAKERSKNFGVKVGEVLEAKNGFVKIKTEDVRVNDGLEIWGRAGQEKNVGFRVSKITNNMIQVKLEGDVRKGDPVYKTFDYELNRTLSRKSESRTIRKIPVKMEFEARSGKNIVLKINGLRVEGEKTAAALKLSTSKEMVKEQLEKLGGTAFRLQDIKIEIDDNLNIPAKNLNALRRKGIEKLEKNIIKSFKRKEKAFERGEKNVPVEFSEAKNRICVQSDDPEVLENLPEGAFRVYTSLKIDTGKLHEKGIEVFQALPKIYRSKETLEIFHDYDGFLVPSLGYLELLPKEKKMVADFTLNIFNDDSIAQVKELGFSGFAPSVENTLDEINELNAKGLEKEVIVYGYLPLMTCEHCVLFATQHCKSKGVAIKDETGAAFPILTDCQNCRMQILNSVPLYFTEIKRLQSDNIRLIHTVETADKFLQRFRKYLEKDFNDKKATTTGHFYHKVE